MEHHIKKLSDKNLKSTVFPAQQSTGNKSAFQLKDNRAQSIAQKKQIDELSNKQTTNIPIQKKENTTGLPDNLKSGIENLSGYSMDDVKVHYHSSKPAQLQAHAYAQGNQIHIAPGQEKHLPHEAWHVVQQKQGRVKPTLQMKGKVNVNDDKGLEKEADVMGVKALQAKGTAQRVKQKEIGNTVTVTVQRVINYSKNNLPVGTKNFLIKNIAKLNSYGNKNRNTKKALHAQFEMIHDIEKKINEFLSANGTQVSNIQRTQLFDILQQTETQHIDLTRRLSENNHDMWLGHTNLSPVKQKQTQALWHSLRKSTGNVKIDTQNTAFKNQVLSGYVHMLGGNHGRGMLREMNKQQVNDDHNVIISDNHLANYQQANKGEQHGGGSWASSIGNIRHDNQHGEDGTGTGSFVQVENGAQPQHMGEYESGEHGEPIFAPKFITLSHELGHARHNLRGTTKQNQWYGVDPQNPLHGHNDEQGKWSNPEEHQNIVHEENPIRLEHHLPKRKYHATIDSGRSTGNRINMTEQLERLYETVPVYLRSMIGPERFGPLNQRVGQTDLSNRDAAAVLQTDINALQNQLPGIITRAKVRYYASYLKPTKKKAFVGGSLLVGAIGLYHHYNKDV